MIRNKSSIMKISTTFRGHAISFAPDSVKNLSHILTEEEEKILANKHKNCLVFIPNNKKKVFPSEVNITPDKKPVEVQPVTKATKKEEMVSLDELKDILQMKSETIPQTVDPKLAESIVNSFCEKETVTICEKETVIVKEEDIVEVKEGKETIEMYNDGKQTEKVNDFFQRDENEDNPFESTPVVAEKKVDEPIADEEDSEPVAETETKAIKKTQNVKKQTGKKKK